MARRNRVMTALALVVALLAPTQAVADEPPPLVNWGELIPGFTPGLDTSDSNVCKRGSHRCVESVLRSMSRTFHQLARRCDHNAIFQLGYMRTTEAYYESSQIPGFYDDVPWMHHYDAVFAEYYLGPQRAWRHNRVSDVPPVWREAFASADAQELSSTGNFLMGMNAHINRDLPFVLDDIGLTDADGNSRKPDHERVNEFLNNVGDDLSPEMIARFDPTWDTNPDDDVLTGFAVQQVIQEWRERAWNAAWLMTYAPEPVAHLVAQGIESGSAELAGLIRQATAASDAERDARNAYCAENWHNWDGGDGTYFDGQDEPLIDAPSFDVPNPTDDLQALAALGVQVEVSIEFGIEITVAPSLLDPVGPLLAPIGGLLGQ
ncbi:DUF5995 family protein [Euzebya tangerina]|uniref:DUF5995 family protein n=1 Tax=Euzebya tangerina TaxID=591198 RepID=UPI000E30B636|nr:DUF5995 family protein [Euzebya tangerina]